MKISNKYNIGDVVFYPGSDLRTARIIKSRVVSILVVEPNGKRQVAYQTKESSYGVREKDMFKTAGPARRRLVELLKEQKVAVGKSIDSAIKQINEASIGDITFDGLADETAEENTEVAAE